MAPVRWRILWAILLVVPLGLVLKFAPVGGGWGWWLHDFGSSLAYEMFWMLAVFLTAARRRAVTPIALGVLAATCVLEVMQLWHPAWLQAVRGTFVGAAALGTTFDWWDFPAYPVGCAAGWGLLWVLVHPGREASLWTRMRRVNKWLGRLVVGTTIVVFAAVIVLWVVSYTHLPLVTLRWRAEGIINVVCYHGSLLIEVCSPVPEPAWDCACQPITPSQAVVMARCVSLARPDPLGFGWMHKTFYITRLGGRQSWYTIVTIPHWALALVTLVVPAWSLRRRWCGWRQRRQARIGLCKRCGYDLRASKDRCPECGEPIPLPPAPPPPSPPPLPPLHLRQLLREWLRFAPLYGRRGLDPPVAHGTRFDVTDTLLVAPDPSVEAQRVLDGLAWPPRQFEAACEPSTTRQSDGLIRFPSPCPLGDAASDQAALDFFAARDPAGKALTAAGVLVLDVMQGDNLVANYVGRSFAARGVHGFVLHMPMRHARRGATTRRSAGNFLARMRQAVGDARRARDVIAALPCVEGGVAIQGTSLGGFLATMAAALDGPGGVAGERGGFAPVFLMLCGGDLYDVLCRGWLDAWFIHQYLKRSGFGGKALREELRRCEPLAVAHRLDPACTYLCSARGDRLVAWENAVKLARAIGLPNDRHRPLRGGHYTSCFIFPRLLDEMVRIVLQGAPAEHPAPPHGH